MLKRILVLVCGVILFSSPVFAGDVIRLKKEIIKTGSDVSQFFGMTKTQKGSRFNPTFGRVYYIVQFDGPVKYEWVQELKNKGVKLNSYLPDDAFIAKIDSQKSFLALNDNAHVKAVLSYDKRFRVSSNFPVLSVFNQTQSQKMVLKLVADGEFNAFVDALRVKNIEVLFHRLTERVMIIEAPLSRLDQISDIEGVEWIEPFYEMQTFGYDMSGEMNPSPFEMVRQGNGDYSSLTGYESGTKLMNFDAAYAKGFHGEGEMVGIADTGLDRGSLTNILDDLKGQVAKGYILGMFAKGWEDPQGHGTHTAGSIVSTGVTSGNRLHGGAYGAKLVEEGMWSPMLNNLSVNPDFDVLFAKLRRDDQIHVHSNSWGSPQNLGAYDNFASMVDDVSWKNLDLLIVFAAGNSGQDIDADGHIDEGSVSSPGTAKNCLTVGASKNLLATGGIQKKMSELKDGTKKWGAEPIASSRLSDNPQGMAAFSSIGPTLDGRLKPDVVAPGTNIVSTRSQQTGASVLWGAYDDFYSYAGGTSMATPLTAGAAAVTRQYLRSQGFQDPSASLVKATMMHTALDLFPGQFGTGKGQEFATPRPNVNEGAGRVDLDAVTSLSKAALVDENTGVRTGESKTYTIDAKAGQKVSVTMVYTDAPASAGSASALVNDLDLSVTSQNGRTVFYPNHLNGPDHKNNSEIIEFTAAASGTYKVIVAGTSVPKGQDSTGAQPFALVLTTK